MKLAHQLEAVLAQYPAACRPTRVESLGSAGGFSGATIWRLSTALGLLCLRQWPQEHPSREQLEFIHAVLLHVGRQGFAQVPVPLAKTSAKTSEVSSPVCGHMFVSQAGHFWELTPWLPGMADYRAHPGAARLQNALLALARFHLAASSFPNVGPAVAPSPGISQRHTLLRDMLGGGLERLSAKVSSGRWPDWECRARRIIPHVWRRGPAILGELATAARWHVPLQPCLRDIWHDHVLFMGNEVSGLVDFGAMRIETVAGDVARLLGSLAGEDAAAWQVGLAAYQTVRPLSPDELRLVKLFDQSTVLLSGLNWLTWVCVEQRDFGDPAQILARLDETIARLENLTSP